MEKKREYDNMDPDERYFLPLNVELEQRTQPRFTNQLVNPEDKELDTQLRVEKSTLSLDCAFLQGGKRQMFFRVPTRKKRKVKKKRRKKNPQTTK
jgi:hypothetical protein